MSKNEKSNNPENNSENNSEISDICIYNSYLIASTYKNTLKVYDCSILKEIIKIPVSFTKISQFKEYLLGISYTNDSLYIIKEENLVFKILNKEVKISKPTYICSNDELVVIGTLNCEVLVLKDTEFNINSIIKTKKIPTALFLEGTKICIATENEIQVIDYDNSEMIFSKEYSCCINSVSMKDNKLAVGLTSGKIYFEDLKVPEESFGFNSHVSHPVSQVILEKYLISSGYDGKIVLWDVNSKRLISTIVENEKFIRKFLIRGDYIDYLIDDGLEEGNKLSSRLINDNM